MNGNLYRYAIVHTPTATKDQIAANAIPLSTIVREDMVIARDEATVRVMAAREIPDDLATNLAEVEIVVRPF